MYTADNRAVGWPSVFIALIFILFNALLSNAFHLGVEISLLTAAARCMVQLGIVATLLQSVLEMKNPWAVAGVILLLNLMAAFETAMNKTKNRYSNMFPSVFICMFGSTIPISIIGVKYSMSVEPFWDPVQYIPVVGMLCGSTISGVTLSLNYILREFQENRDKIEMYLAFGASRSEACRPMIAEALRLALTPTINQMSVLGIISIPGMMTGAMLGGSSVQEAAKLQMIIMFMLSASTALASICCSAYATSILVDEEHRVRPDRIYAKFSWGEMSRVGNLIGTIRGLGIRLARKAARVTMVRRDWVELPTRRDERLLTL
ncbi:hypothetical protein D9758_010187 [Tetrapyrgos nigripes]|uniref:Uncharacterized protein n=1 Tax=Tetrapyrgos nigripes TaxID=182062 RepID=A0A8H5D075_9AGAR|nr:hypothetical protein D9758_010187 [Tetrapyrgos nigripes]